MSVTLKLSDDDANLVARTLKAVADGLKEAKAFGFAELKREYGIDDSRPATDRLDVKFDNGILLDNRRDQIAGNALREITRRFGTDGADIEMIAHAFKVAHSANARGN